MARGKAVEITLSDGERSELQALVRRQGTAQALAWRARIVLLAAEGRINKAIAAALGGGQHTVGKWRTRFAEPGSTGCRTSRGRARRARSATPRLPK